MGTRRKSALVLLGAAIATTVGLAILDRPLLVYVPFVTAGFAIGGVYLWVTAK